MLSIYTITHSEFCSFCREYSNSYKFLSKAISSFRPDCDIIAITPIQKTARQMNLIWGVTPLFVDKDYADKMISVGINTAKDAGFVKSGDMAVIGGSDTYDYHNQSAFNSYKTIGGICKI